MACLFRGNLRDKYRTSEYFEIVIKSIFKLFDNDNIDFYMHIWGDENSDQSKIYEKYIKKDNLIIENNSKYEKEILELMGKLPESKNFNQISSSISLTRSCEILKSKNIEYDIIFITRPDLPFTQKIKELNINDDVVYFNRHGNYIESGDYCFILSYKNVDFFQNLYDFLKNNYNTFKPTTHYWFYDYIKNICKKKVELSSIDVGVNCEIFFYLENQYPEILNSVNKFIN